MHYAYRKFGIWKQIKPDFSEPRKQKKSVYGLLGHRNWKWNHFGTLEIKFYIFKNSITVKIICNQNTCEGWCFSLHIMLSDL